MKHQDIRKKLIIETSIIAAIFAVIGSGVLYLDMMSEERAQEKARLETELMTVTTERQNLQDKFQKVQGNPELYLEVMEKSANEGLAISRQLLRQKINEFKTRYFLNDMKLNMAPTQEMQGDQYKYKTALMNFSRMDATFDALNDEDIYSLVRAFQNELSGTLKITKFTIQRTSPLSDESLRAIAKNGQYSLVKGEIYFTWFGIKPTESDNARQ